MSGHKERKQLFKLLKRHDFLISQYNNGHYAITPPDYIKSDPNQRPFTCSATPRDWWRTRKNVIAWARRHGLPRVSH